MKSSDLLPEGRKSQVNGKFFLFELFEAKLNASFLSRDLPQGRPRGFTLGQT